MGMDDTKKDFTKNKAIAILIEDGERFDKAIDELKIQLDGMNLALSDYFDKYDEPWKHHEKELSHDEVLDKLRSYSFFVEEFIERFRFSMMSGLSMDLMYRIENDDYDSEDDT